MCGLLQLEPADQIALIAAGFCQLLCLRIAREFTTAPMSTTHGGRLLPIGGGLAVMLGGDGGGAVIQCSSAETGATQSTDDLYSVFESIIRFSFELDKLDLDVTETAMFAAATLVQPGL